MDPSVHKIEPGKAFVSKLTFEDHILFRIERYEVHIPKDEHVSGNEGLVTIKANQIGNITIVLRGFLANGDMELPWSVNMVVQQPQQEDTKPKE